MEILLSLSHDRMSTCLGFKTAPTNFPSPAIWSKLSVGNKIIFLEFTNQPICSGHITICQIASNAPSRSSKLAVILLLIIWKIYSQSLSVFFLLRSRVIKIKTSHKFRKCWKFKSPDSLIWTVINYILITICLLKNSERQWIHWIIYQNTKEYKEMSRMNE